MKKLVLLSVIAFCIVTSFLTDTAAIYTKTVPAIIGTITTKDNSCTHYPYWDSQKELNHQYKINAIVQYNNILFIRRNSGTSQNHLTPDKNKSWEMIECDKCEI